MGDTLLAGNPAHRLQEILYSRIQEILQLNNKSIIISIYLIKHYKYLIKRNKYNISNILITNVQEIL